VNLSTGQREVALEYQVLLWNGWLRSVANNIPLRE